MSSAAGPPAGSPDVLLRRENGVPVVTINRPAQRNAVNGAVSAGIARALDLLDDSSDLRAGVLPGAGTAFCAGQALAAALALAAQVAASAPMSVRASKAVAVESAGWPLAEGFQRQRRDPVWRDR